MHELSIIASIVDIAEEQLRRSNATQIEKIELEIGELAGVEWQALDFAWEVGVQRSALQNAERQIDKIPGRAQCLECDTTFELPVLYEPCPACGSYFNTILQGKELRVKALTVT